MGDEPAISKENRAEWICLAFVITFAACAVPYWAWVLVYPNLPNEAQVFLGRTVGMENTIYLAELVFGLALAVPTWQRSGLRLGKWRGRGRGLVLVCILPALIAGALYALLPERPFHKSGVGMWLISPLAQDLVFMGYLYGRFEELFPEYLHPRLPLRWALVLASVFFALWHLPNMAHESIGVRFTLFQMAYTFVGGCFVGLSRQWTGSMLYFTCSHMLINAIAWATP